MKIRRNHHIRIICEGSPDHLMLIPCKRGLKEYSLLAGRNHPSHLFWLNTALYSARESFPAVGLSRWGGIEKKECEKMQKVVSVQSTAIPLEANHKHSHYSALHYHVTLLFPTVTGAFQRQDCSVIVTYRERPADSEVKQSIQNIPAILFKHRLPNGVYTSSFSCLNRNTKR